MTIAVFYKRYLTVVPSWASGCVSCARLLFQGVASKETVTHEHLGVIDASLDYSGKVVAFSVLQVSQILGGHAAKPFRPGPQHIEVGGFSVVPIQTKVYFEKLVAFHESFNLLFIYVLKALMFFTDYII